MVVQLHFYMISYFNICVIIYILNFDEDIFHHKLR